jgi:WYL domain
MSLEIICSAIQSLRVIQFYYAGDTNPGLRRVEPHMVAYTSADNLVLSAWFLGGVTGSNAPTNWREYLLSQMSQVMMTAETFAGSRPGYNPSGGKKFHNIQCSL